MTEEIKTEETGKLLSREDIFNVEDIEYLNVFVPEWSGSIRLKTLSASQAMMFIEMTPEQRANILPKMVCESAVDEAGKFLFNKGDETKLSGKSLRAFMRLQNALLEMNGLTEKATTTAKNE